MTDSGYEIIEAAFSSPEGRSLIAALANSETTRSRAGARHLMSHPAVQHVASDERLLEIARGELGPAAAPYRATLFEKSGESNWLVVWHQDTALPLVARRNAAGWGPWSMKAGITYAHAPSSALAQVVALRIHLDTSADDNGPLRVLPGTHCMGVLANHEILAAAERISPVTCTVDRGGVLVMRPLLVHASSKATGSAPRRVLHIEYAARRSFEHGIQLRVARDQ